MVRRLKSLASILSVLALLLLATSVGAQEPKPAANIATAAQLVATKVISPSEQKAALAFWSRKAIAATKPMAILTQTSPLKVDTTVAQPEVAGPIGMAPGGLAASDAEQVARAAYPQDWAIVEKRTSSPTLLDPALFQAEAAESAKTNQIAPAGTSQVYTSYIANPGPAMQLLYPHVWIGRISFSTPGGTSFCSGTSISGNVMVTAAHCLYDTTNNSWYSNWVFAPAYRNGSAPYGIFAATQCWVLNTWINQTGNYSIANWARHDVAVCKMGTNSAGVTLNNAVGWMGRQWNAPYVRHFHDFGYPFYNFNNALLPSAGAFLRTCVGESFIYTTETRGIGCNFGGGISGGPWMANYALGGPSGYVDGVNSGMFIGALNMFGARFNSANIVQLCNAAAC